VLSDSEVTPTVTKSIASCDGAPSPNKFSGTQPDTAFGVSGVFATFADVDAAAGPSRVTRQTMLPSASVTASTALMKFSWTSEVLVEIACERP